MSAPLTRPVHAASVPDGAPFVTPSAVLRVVLYFDVFGHPLTRAEIVRFVAPDHDRAVDDVIEALLDAGTLAQEGSLVYVPGRSDGVPRRHAKARNAERRWADARRSASVLARFPWVQAVLVTGGMSKNSIAADGDVDYLLIVDPGRVWLVKATLQVFRAALPHALRELFCTNYILARDQLRIDERNMFTAIELATAVPMYGPEACVALIDANPWAADLVTGMPWSRRRARNAPDVPRRRRLGRGHLADRLDPLVQRAFSAYWDRKYRHLDDAVRAQRFKRRRDVATNHLNDHQQRVLDAWRQRLEAHDL